MSAIPSLRYLLGTCTILLYLSVHYFLSGAFLTKLVLTTKNIEEPRTNESGRQVIMLLVDALREDFVEMDEGLLKGTYSS
jgi:hypothetical protein